MIRVAIAAWLLCLTACKKESPPDSEPQVRALVAIDDCDGLRSYLSDVMLESVIGYRYGSAWWGWNVDPATDTSASDGGPSDYTTTNVQVPGVDEIDLVKTDGAHLYTAIDQEVFIVDSWPAEESHRVATIELDGWARGLFLKGDQLVVFEHVYAEPAVGALGGSGGTRVRVYDITDRSDPQVSQTIDIEGWLLDGRMIDGQVYLVFNHWTPLPEELWELVWDADLGLPELDWTLTGTEFELARDRAIAEARTILEPRVAALAATLSLDEVLPQWVVHRAGDPPASPERMLACDDLYRPVDPTQYGNLSVVQLDLATGTLNTTGILSNGWTVYASSENLYVAQTSWWSWWGWDDLGMTTHLHAFALDPVQGPSYSASGVVDGWLYDSFAMSEYGDQLRVVTTDQDWWWGVADGAEPEPGNNVFVLEDDGDGTLARVGALRGIAPGERIYASRMIGRRGYLVTFRRVDPLFTIDLSDPSEPRLAGVLEMPGYSAYLHPLGDDHLVAVGMAGEDSGVLTGLAVNLYDVSDFYAPQLVDQYVLNDRSWSWSEALWDHHAFTLSRSVLSIPAYYADDDPSDGELEWFSGLLVLSVQPEGIAELGRVDHRDLVEGSECLYARYYAYDEAVCDSTFWYATIRRSVYIQDSLYSVSNYGIKVNALAYPEVVRTSVLFHPAP